MRKIEEVLRLKCGHKLSNRQIAKSCLISHSNTISEKADPIELPLTPLMIFLISCIKGT